MRNHSSAYRVRLYAACVAALLMLGACGGGGGGNNDNDASVVPGAPIVPDPPIPPVITKPQAANPEVEGPVIAGGGENCCRLIVELAEVVLSEVFDYEPGTPFYSGLRFDEADVGYRESEYFISGTATSYVPKEALGQDGVWSVQPADAASYKSRIVVLRPENAADFNGTVVVEWLNVSLGFDAAPDLIQMHTELLRRGYAWVGVSAQEVGIEGGGDTVDVPLTLVDAERYGSLNHPGDSFSYDIYSQAAQAVRHPTGIDPLDGLVIQQMIGVGESQSAGRMATYVNAIHSTINLFDGFLIHSRGGSRSAPLSQEPQAAVTTPDSTLIRGDFPEPVLDIETETDIFGFGTTTVSQPDATNYRQWEVAGTAHYDAYGVVKGPEDKGGDPDMAKVTETGYGGSALIAMCDQPVNDGPGHWVLNAGIAALDHWIRTGEPAPSAQPLARNAEGTALQRDEFGNAVAGVRTPYVDAPVATFSGEGQSDSEYCNLLGATKIFDFDRLTTLYPTLDDYTKAIDTATDSAVEKGFILPEDGELIKTQARNPLF